MSRLTLRLPETLHRQLEAQARHENVSLNQYLVYALTRYASASYLVTAVSNKDVQQQRADYERLVRSLRRGSTEEVRAAMDKREEIPPEPELDPELVERLRRRINEARENNQAVGADE